jgi:hypothetical protein
MNFWLHIKFWLYVAFVLCGLWPVALFIWFIF